MVDERRSRARRWAGAAVRIAFVAAVLGFTAWAFRDDWPEVLRLVQATPWWAIGAAVVLGAAGILLSVPMWTSLAHAFGLGVPVRAAASILLIGQVGKYLPGSVWAVAVQATLLRRRQVPVRRAVSASLLYIGVHLTTALAFGAVVLLVGGNPWGIPAWVLVAVGIASLAAVTPPVLHLIARLVAGRSADFRLSWLASAGIIATMAGVWVCWVGTPVALAHRVDTALVLAIAGATLVGYAAGLVVVVAPAGVGVREAIFVSLVAPVVGTVEALSIALLTRVVTVIVDLALAGVAWLASRRELAEDQRDPSPDL
jgi:glycosyltransferase 2 family protein